MIFNVVDFESFLREIDVTSINQGFLNVSVGILLAVENWIRISSNTNCVQRILSTE